MKKPYLVVSGAMLVPNVGWLIAKRSETERAFPSCWEFPGGKVNEFEPREVALVREWKEELDIDVEVVSGVIARAVFQPPGFDDIDISLYVVRRRDDRKIHMSVHDAHQYIELEALLQMSITDVTPSTPHFAATLWRRILRGERWPK